MNEVNTNQGVDFGIVEMIPFNGTPDVQRNYEGPDSIIRADLQYRQVVETRYGDKQERVSIDPTQWSFCLSPMCRVKVPVHFIPEGAVLSSDPFAAFEQGLVVLGHGVDENDGYYYLVIINLSTMPTFIFDGMALSNIQKTEEK